MTYRGCTIIIAADLADGDAERLALGGLTTDQARVVTPRSPYRARGVVGDRLVVTHAASSLPTLPDLRTEVAPCFATMPKPSDSGVTKASHE